MNQSMNHLLVWAIALRGMNEFLEWKDSNLNVHLTQVPYPTCSVAMLQVVQIHKKAIFCFEQMTASHRSDVMTFKEFKKICQ